MTCVVHVLNKSILVTMLRSRRSKKIVKHSADDASDSSLAWRHADNEYMQTINNSANLESTVFGGESRITEQLESYEVVTSGSKVSSVTGLLNVFVVMLTM